MHDILPTKIVGKGASAMDKFIYMDNAATTKVAKEVLDSWQFISAIRERL